MKKKEESKGKKSAFKEFLDKYKNDKKYNAKVQLIGYGVLIGIIILYANINSAQITSYRKTYPSRTNRTNNINTNQESKNETLLEKIDKNYQYDIKVLSKGKEEKKEIHYYGKKYQNNMEITKELDGITTNYYKVDSRYYTKENDNYNLAKQEDIYNIVEKEYIELPDIKEYINLASLDHKTEYSNGKKEYVYHLAVKNVIKSYQGTEEIEINIIEENNELTIKINYTNLIKEIDKETEECTIEYIYTNIDTVEEFTIIENNEETQ